ncbi:BsuPI-related putative proteinase inhibitor [Cytobacillus purgationiresistens]|uniref:Intracellular proteinase inhibitor BsuPI domain-containing protein n=1 Tax=Cytobacillus purgationiresistens TaxID=863449 RepID=A0ABU0AD17_9BACI|nr:BsuPI-related putative proteinase inhibitor [Cytobacillus purgationiresistens]MDQ0268774.1 hypothetical protein [Cytobacillus purgationiresistens]
MLHLLLAFGIMMSSFLPGQYLMEANQTNMPITFEIYTNPGMDALEMDLVVENSSDQTVTLEFPTSQRYELVIRDENGEIVYDYSKGKSFLQVIQNLELQPKETKKWQEKWDYMKDGKRVSEGDYRIEANLTGQVIQPSGLQADLKAKTSFQLPPLNQSFSDMRVSGHDGEYTVVGRHHSKQPFYYTVEDGHHQLISEKLHSSDKEDFAINILLKQEKLPENGSIIAYFYEKSNGKMVNTFPVLLESF